MGQRGPRSIDARASQSSGRSAVRNKEEETQTGFEGMGFSDDYKSISEGELGILRKDVAQKEREQMDLKAKAEEQEQVIKSLMMEIEVLQGEVEEMQLQAQQDGEEYKKQSDVLQLTVEVQRGTQKVMNTALDVLREFYREKVAAALQREGEGSPTNPVSRYA